MVVASANVRVVCGHGGVRSEGDVDCAATRIRSREGLDSVQPQVSIAEWDSLAVQVLGHSCATGAKSGSATREFGSIYPETAVVGFVGAVVASVIGVAQGGAWKEKSMNSLVEALGSPAQQHVIVVARSRRGRGQPSKGSGMVESGVEVANNSLTDSNIQARQRFFVVGS
ncbi:hypothetical protein V6N12_050411 [Hibiscus sabdariffa]|uniref:Uncharacterized protein n=1 Tax=Hibiscus sabdariffa TaxID=183260 RepID=A0ABR2GCG9_9ROSI